MHRKAKHTIAGTAADIVDLYNRVVTGRLVIVGAPGGGKTGAAVLLLLLALSDIPRIDGRIPVWFLLASWDPRTATVDQWMADQLATTYGTPRPVPGRWSTTAGSCQSSTVWTRFPRSCGRRHWRLCGPWTPRRAAPRRLPRDGVVREQSRRSRSRPVEVPATAMRGLKRLRSARVISAGHAFVQNLRRGHYDITTHIDPSRQLSAAFANSPSLSDPGHQSAVKSDHPQPTQL